MKLRNNKASFVLIRFYIDRNIWIVIYDIFLVCSYESITYNTVKNKQWLKINIWTDVYFQIWISCQTD